MVLPQILYPLQGYQAECPVDDSAAQLWRDHPCHRAIATWSSRGRRTVIAALQRHAVATWSLNEEVFFHSIDQSRVALIVKFIFLNRLTSHG